MTKEIDWIELGCLGWDIDETGAGMDAEWQEGPGFRCCEDDYAHIDRETLDLLLYGCPQFVVRVINHLLWCHYVKLGGPRLRGLVQFETPPLSNTYTAGGFDGSFWGQHTM